MSSSLKIPELTDERRDVVAAGRKWWNENFPGFIDLLTERVKEEIDLNFKGLECVLDRKGGRKTKRKGKKRRKGKTRKVKRGGGKNTPWWLCVRKCVACVTSASVLLIAVAAAVGGPLFGAHEFIVYQFEPNMTQISESVKKSYTSCSDDEAKEELNYGIGPAVGAAINCAIIVGAGGAATVSSGGATAPHAFSAVLGACSVVPGLVFLNKQAEGKIIYKCDQRMGYGWNALASILITPGGVGGAAGIYLVYAILCAANTFAARNYKKMMGVWELIYDKIWKYDGAYLGYRCLASMLPRQLSGWTVAETDQLYAEIETCVRKNIYNNDVALLNKTIAILKQLDEGEGLVGALSQEKDTRKMRKALLSYRNLKMGEVTTMDIGRERDDRDSGGSGGSSSGSSGDSAIAALTADENQAVSSMRKKMREGLLEPLVFAGTFQPVTADMQRNVFYAIYAVGIENLKKVKKMIKSEKERTRHNETKACVILTRFFGALGRHGLDTRVQDAQAQLAFQHNMRARAANFFASGVAAAQGRRLLPANRQQPLLVQNLVLGPNTPRGPTGTGGPTFQEVPESSPAADAVPAAAAVPAAVAESSPLNMLIGNRLDGLFGGGRRLRKRKVRKKGTKKKARGTKRKARKKGTKKRGRRTKRRTRNN